MELTAGSPSRMSRGIGVCQLINLPAKVLIWPVVTGVCETRVEAPSDSSRQEVSNRANVGDTEGSWVETFVSEDWPVRLGRQKQKQFAAARHGGCDGIMVLFATRVKLLTPRIAT